MKTPSTPNQSGYAVHVDSGNLFGSTLPGAKRHGFNLGGRFRLSAAAEFLAVQ
jgi:hypothetical protein